MFNGDFQNLSHYAVGVNGIQSTFSHCQLTDHYENFIKSHPTAQANQETCLRTDRLNGLYFECRIFRPLHIDDIETIYVSDTEGPAQELLKDYIKRRADSLENLWNEKFFLKNKFFFRIIIAVKNCQLVALKFPVRKTRHFELSCDLQFALFQFTEVHC